MNKAAPVLTEGGMNRNEEMRDAAIGGDVDVITNLVGKGFDVDTPLDKDGRVALIYACYHANIGVVQLLLQHRANHNYSTQIDKFTALMAVGSSESNREEDLVECASALIEARARPNEQDRYQMTPLLYACKNQHDALAKFLIQFSDVNSKDQKGWSALSYAADNGNTDLVKQLLDAGAIDRLHRGV